MTTEKMLSEEEITALEEKGFRRWQKGMLDRLYINAAQLGLEYSRYNTGNISSAAFRGEYISNSQARRMLNAKTYVDVESGRVWSDEGTLKEAAEEIVSGIRNCEQ